MKFNERVWDDGFRNELKRYSALFRICNERKPKKIMEIGIWQGQTSLEFINIAKQYNPPEEIEFYGFDLFEDFGRKKAINRPLSVKECYELLNPTGVQIRLFRGDTKIVLPVVINGLPVMDLIYIDGDHKITSIQSDWDNCQKLMDSSTIVIFDDYWNTTNRGCKRLIDALDREKFKVDMLEPSDTCPRANSLVSVKLL